MHVARILSDMKPFAWMKTVIPTHIHHSYSASMSQRNEVFNLPIIHKNEAKYEDCLDIMDTMENCLQQVYREAHGNLEMLEKFKVVTGGDQLTKVRFDGAANLRLLSPTAAGRLDHLKPRICELWHLKQDFLEKCYKILYKADSQRQEGTLSHFKNILKKNNVTGKVKGKFQSHSDFLKLLTVCLVQEQAIELFGMVDRNDIPSVVPENISKMSKPLKENLMRQVALLILENYEYLSEVKDLPKNSQDKNEDELYNYCCNLCTWGLHLMQLDDMAKEGDITRIIPNLKLCLPFLYSHSNRSKYLEQAIDYICQTQYLLSPLNKIRVLEGSFINLKGGIGNNIEADLVQEHSVREQKVLIKGLGANKSENAISVVTAAASAVTRICNQFDETFSVSKVSTRHTSKTSQKDHEIVQEVLQRIHPFKFQSGRKCAGFSALKSNQCKQINLNCMLSDYEQLLERILQGHITIPEVDEDAVLSSDEEEIPELP
ncbi:hypothetical protein KUTeg_023482 [Tegillarca granosa]|uniref:DUF6589 domain-containing protein n=1 Tax=Tegillarca granosa TaxID=220873 RepID=A0ABQ9E2B3_TEGGR|nr:hypothetical protein KUTeg_023482 [Tegillarca granosa]